MDKSWIPEGEGVRQGGKNQAGLGHGLVHWTDTFLVTNGSYRRILRGRWKDCICVLQQSLRCNVLKMYSVQWPGSAKAADNSQPLGS